MKFEGLPSARGIPFPLSADDRRARIVQNDAVGSERIASPQDLSIRVDAEDTFTGSDQKVPVGRVETPEV